MSVQEYVYTELRKAGMTLEGACAVLGNLEAESAFRPNNVEDRSGISDEQYTAMVDNGSYTKDKFVHDAYGYGLAQWTFYTRKSMFWDLAKMKGKSIGDLGLQTEFLIWEMQNYFPNCWEMCCKKHDLQLCTWTLLDKWENPAEKNNNFRVRLLNATKWMQQMEHVKFDAAQTQHQSSGTAVIVGEGANGAEKEPKVDADGIRIDETWPPRTLDRKCSGWKEVRLLESLLFCHGYNVLNDGIFADLLEEKLIDFQRTAGLTADGVCGPKTWKALMELPKGF